MVQSLSSIKRIMEHLLPITTKQYYRAMSKVIVNARPYTPGEDVSEIDMWFPEESPEEGMMIVEMPTGTFMMSQEDFNSRFTPVPS